MKTQDQSCPQFSQAHLDNLIIYRIDSYRVSASDHKGVGAPVIVSGDFPSQYLENVIAHAQNGFTLAPTPAHHTPTYCFCYMVKDGATQLEEIANLSVQVEAEYRANLELEKAKWIDEQSKILLKQRQEQEAAKAAALEAKQLAQLRKELEANLSK